MVSLTNISFLLTLVIVIYRFVLQFMSKKNSKPQQSKISGETVELANLKLAQKVEIETTEEVSLEQPHLALLKGYLNTKLLNKKISIGQTFVATIKGKESTFKITNINSRIQTSNDSKDKVEELLKEQVFYVVNANTEVCLVKKKGQEAEKLMNIEESCFYGYNQELNDLKQSILNSLFQRESLISKGLSPIKGILISGFSGAGKSAILRQLQRDFASEKTFIYWKAISSVQMLSRVVGGAQEFIRTIFKTLKEKSPSVLTIQDLHLLFGAKEVSSHETVLATLLSEMDSIERESIVVIGTFNADRELTKTMYSAGKFQKQISLSYPNHTQRLQILNQMMQRLCLKEKIDIEELKKINLRLNGFSIGQIKNILREAFSQEGQNLTFGQLEDVVKRYRPAQIKQLIVQVPEVRWDQIGGYQSVKKQIRKVVELPLQHADKFKKFGIEASKGILLYGPPGCSKTMMAKAIATESKLNFIGIKGPELFSKYVGESQRAIRNIFKRARACSPCVIFFDEIDALATQRSANTQVTDRVLCQLLNEMDGIEGLKEVAIVAATNRPQILDKALMRPGRFDYLIYVSPPDEKARKQILQIYLQKSVNKQQVEALSEMIAKKTQNYTGAELSLICRQAVLLALQQNINSQKIEVKHLESALKKVKNRLTWQTVTKYQQFNLGLRD